LQDFDYTVLGATGVKLTIFSRSKHTRRGLDNPAESGDATEQIRAESSEGSTLPDPPAPGAETPELRERRIAELRRLVNSDMYEIPVPQLVRILAARLLGRR
jgi:hypothetical protein